MYIKQKVKAFYHPTAAPCLASRHSETTSIDDSAFRRYISVSYI